MINIDFAIINKALWSQFLKIIGQLSIIDYLTHCPPPLKKAKNPDRLDLVGKLVNKLIKIVWILDSANAAELVCGVNSVCAKLLHFQGFRGGGGATKTKKSPKIPYLNNMPVRQRRI